MMYSYIDAISEGYPNIHVYTTGDAFNYNDIQVEDNSTLPSKEDLDTWIVARTRLYIWKLIKTERDRRREDGGYKVGQYWFHSDDTSRIQQLGLVLSGQNLPGTIMWKTMSGEFVEMTPTLAAQIFQAAGLSDIA